MSLKTDDGDPEVGETAAGLGGRQPHRVEKGEERGRAVSGLPVAQQGLTIGRIRPPSSW
jgi:hypothetical protein